MEYLIYTWKWAMEADSWTDEALQVGFTKEYDPLDQGTALHLHSVSCGLLTAMSLIINKTNTIFAECLNYFNFTTSQLQRMASFL